MSREMKFRAWDKLQSKMLEWNKKNFSNNDFTYDIDTWTALRLSIKDLTKPRYKLMQFIGLKDKNGKEVYEDDIIEFENQGKYVIIYREDSAMFYVRPTTNGEQIPIWLEYSKKNCPYEVIGNIYENPELLED